MLSRRPLQLLAVLGVLPMASLALTSPTAFGQHTPDPYNIVGEYNSQYEPFMFATEPNADGILPNQNRLRSRAGFRTANRFQSYLDGPDSMDGEFDRGANFRRSGNGTRYYDVFRKYDEGFGRVYRPNEKADESFYSQLDERNQKYFDARKEKDPRKRAQLLREYNLEKLRAARSLSASRSGFERAREPARAGGSSALDEEGNGLFNRSTQPGVSSGRSSGSDSDPPLRSPRLSAPASPATSRLSAPQPPTARSSGGLGRSTRSAAPSTSSDLPSRVLERNEHFDEPRLVPPSSSSAPAPPR